MLIFTPSLALVVAIEQGVSQVDIQLYLDIKVLCCFHGDVPNKHYIIQFHLWFGKGGSVALMQHCKYTGTLNFHKRKNAA